MSKLILVRHALPVIDPAKPSEEWVLADEGRTATVALAQKLTTYAPRIVLGGTEPKMEGTGKLLAERFGVGFAKLGGLSEHQRRSSSFTDKETFEAAIRNLFDQPHEIVYGDESANQTYDRFSAALDGQLAVHKGETVAAVSGGTAICLFLARRAGVEPFPTWKELRMPMAFVLNAANWKIDEIV